MTTRLSTSEIARRMLRRGWGIDVVAGFLYMRTLEEAGVSLTEAGGLHCLSHAAIAGLHCAEAELILSGDS